jgi:hypothetical protein
MRFSPGEFTVPNPKRADFLDKYLDVYETGADLSVASEGIVPHGRSNLHPEASQHR